MIPLVLSIDDDQSSQILMRAYLKDESFCNEFVSKANGQEGLNYLKDICAASTADAWPAVIFLDINMPVLDGWGFLTQFEDLCQQHGTYPIVVTVSATTPSEDRDRDRANTHPLVLSLVQKPINSKTIEQISQVPSLCHFFKSKRALSTHN
jgi:CheY-like chemotaxis protein